MVAILPRAEVAHNQSVPTILPRSGMSPVDRFLRRIAAISSPSVLSSGRLMARALFLAPGIALYVSGRQCSHPASLSKAVGQQLHGLLPISEKTSHVLSGSSQRILMD